MARPTATRAFVKDAGASLQSSKPEALEDAVGAMTGEAHEHLRSARDEDLYAWLLNRANELRSHQPAFLDWSELAEELDEVVALARNQIVSRVRTVIIHLLKWRYQRANRDEPSWRNSIVRERQELDLLLASKNLRNYLEEAGFSLPYHQARRAAGSEMGIDRNALNRRFPASCEWTLAKVLDEEFFPALPQSGSR